MRTIETWGASALPVSLLAATPAFANLAPQSANGIAYVSGGVGADEEATMRQMRQQYRLQMLFAVQGTGEYLADIPVTITDPQGRTVLETTAQGPFLYANLPAGTYRVTAVSDGRAITRMVTVPKRGAIEERFYWSGQRNAPASAAGAASEMSPPVRSSMF
jgi:hypothetical protein